MAKTYNDIYIQARKRLKDAGIEAYGLEARLIVSQAAGKTMEKLMRDLNLYSSDEFAEQVEAMVERRIAGEPVAYITGQWEFYGVPLYITRDALIPRGDTEVLVKAAITLFENRNGRPRILDLCAGSGCVGVAICVEADVRESPPLLLGDFDLITCNAPYIPTAELAQLDPSVRDYEPVAALDGGEDGLDIIRPVIRLWKSVLRDNGVIMLEIGEGQAPAVTDLLTKAGFTDVQALQDTGGTDRVMMARIRKQ